MKRGGAKMAFLLSLGAAQGQTWLTSSSSSVPNSTLGAAVREPWTMGLALS